MLILEQNRGRSYVLPNIIVVKDSVRYCHPARPKISPYHVYISLQNVFGHVPLFYSQLRKAIQSGSCHRVFSGKQVSENPSRKKVNNHQLLQSDAVRPVDQRQQYFQIHCIETPALHFQTILKA